MGAKCCMPLREDRSLILRRKYRNCAELSDCSNIRNSPSWSFRWDSRTHVEDNVDNPASQRHSGTVSLDYDGMVHRETEGPSNGGSPSDALQTPKLENFPKRLSCPGNFSAGSTVMPESDQSNWSNSSPEEKEAGEPLSIASASDSKQPSSVARADPLSSESCPLSTSDPISSRKARRSPGYPLLRQVSVSRISTLNSLNELSPEVRQSMLSACSNDISAGGSQVGRSSSEGWSTRSLSEFAASSEQESWSFGSQYLSKMARTNIQPSQTFIPIDSQTCGVCSNLLKERAWNTEISIVAVLACGHVYHSECLESVTPEAHKFDPSCPTCTSGENSSPKLLVKSGWKARSKISKRAVADIDVHGDSFPDRCKNAWPTTKSSFARPFLRRHFSIGSRSDSESSKKKGFWSRYR